MSSAEVGLTTSAELAEDAVGTNGFTTSLPTVEDAIVVAGAPSG
jgi:hypothetical protein